MAKEYKFFEVTIPVAVDTAAIGEGFIDNRDVLSFGTMPSTTALSLDKERANARYESIIKELGLYGNENVIDVIVAGGDQDNPPTEIKFKVKFHNDKVVYYYDRINDPTMKTVVGPASELDKVGINSTVVNMTEEDVIKRIVATALAQDSYDNYRDYYDIAVPKNIHKFGPITVSPLGTGVTAAARLADIEGVATFTVVAI